MRFENKKILITGSTGYIGRKIAESFVNEGGIVSICGRSQRKCEEIADEINSAGSSGKAYPISLNVREYESVKKAIREFALLDDGIDILVNCAGGGTREKRKGLENQDIELIREIIDINLMGTIYCSKETLRYFPSHGGSIVNVTSIHGHMGMETYSEYSAAKGGVIAFTRALAKEQGYKNIRVNNVSYGLIAREDLYGEQRVRHIYTNYLNKLPTVEEITSGVLYLASEAAGFVSGADLVIDGGRSLALKGSDEGKSLDDLRDFDFASRCAEVAEKVVRNAKGRDIYVYGAGHGGEILVNEWKNSCIKIAGVYDKRAKEIHSFLGISVNLPDEAKGRSNTQYIVISLMDHNHKDALEIANELKNMGFGEDDIMTLSENEFEVNI